MNRKSVPRSDFVTSSFLIFGWREGLSFMASCTKGQVFKYLILEFLLSFGGRAPLSLISSLREPRTTGGRSGDKDILSGHLESPLAPFSHLSRMLRLRKRTMMPASAALFSLWQAAKSLWLMSCMFKNFLASSTHF